MCYELKLLYHSLSDITCLFAVVFCLVMTRPLKKVNTNFYREVVTVASYARKQSKTTILLSSMHDPKSQKPGIITYYNSDKNGLSTMDEKFSKSSTGRRTRRWPLRSFVR